MKMPGQPCATCGRSGGAVNLGQGNKHTQFCSDSCARDFLRLGPNLKHDEVKALEKGGEAAGGYLESIGKTDLARLTVPEWAEFCGRLYRATCTDLAHQADDEIPF